MLIRDVLITGLGLAVIASQVWSAHPNGNVLLTGLALTVPSVADHVRALLPSGAPPSSPSSPPAGPQPSPPSPAEGSTGGSH